MEEKKVLFVCTGNICRSPTAEGVMRRFVADACLEDRVYVDSAGTHGYYAGSPPDRRAQAAALRRGYDLRGRRARQISPSDFSSFDLLLAMDFKNMEVLLNLCPQEDQSKIGLLMPYARNRSAAIVHDPYQRGAKDFDLVLDYIEDACRGLLATPAPDKVESISANAVATTRGRNRSGDALAGGAVLRARSP